MDGRYETDFSNHIVVDPRILVGKPTVKGTRIPVSMIINLVAHEMTFNQIIDDYPTLTHESIQAAILYASDRLERDISPPAELQP